MNPHYPFHPRNIARLTGNQSRKAALMSLASTLALHGTAAAATATWTGGAAPDANWSAAGNWSVAPVSGDDLHFSGTAGLANVNDLNTDATTGGTFAINSLTFDAEAGESFEITGNPISFNGRTITNNSAFAQNVLVPLLESGAGMTAAGDGNLNLTSISTTGFNRTFTKNGAGITVVGYTNSSFSLLVNAGTLDWNGDVFGTCNIGAGTLLARSIFHWNTHCTLSNAESKLAFAGSSRELGELDAVAGSTISSADTEGAITVIYLNQSGRTSDIAGSIQDGATGGRLSLRVGTNGTPVVNLSGANTYTGDTEVNATLNLASTGSLKFKVYPGFSNKITGTGTVTLDGAIDIDLSGAEFPNPGDTWLLVGASHVTYGGAFSVSGFTETSSGIWKFTDGTGSWYFSEATGKLGFEAIPESVWDGDSGGAWSVGGNWTSGTPPVNGDIPVFTGTNIANNNDLDTAWDSVNEGPGTVSLGGIRFGAAASTFNLGGNQLYLEGGVIENLSTNPQSLATPLGAGNGGFTVNTSAGTVTLTGALNNYSADNRPLVKTGTGTLVLNGTQNNGWALNVNGGTLQVFNPAGTSAVGSSGNIATGAILRTETSDTFSPTATVTVNGGGTLNLAGGGESLGSLNGTGTVTNHGDGSGTAVVDFIANNSTWNGSIQDGGNRTSVTLSGTTSGANSISFGGANTYTGDTTVGPDASFVLANGGSMKFAPKANGVSNRITGDQTAGTGSVSVNGLFNLDLSGASLANGNSWTLVNAAALVETFGANFKVSDTAVVPPVNFKVNGGNSAVAPFVASAGFVTGTNTLTQYSRGNAINVSAVTDPAPQGVYQTELYVNGNMTYTFNGLNAGGNYKVRLHFAELYHTAVGMRKFDVSVNGTLLLDDYDVIAVTGARYKAVVEETIVAANGSGVVTVDFLKGPNDNPKINGIEIIDVSSASTDFAQVGDVWSRVDGNKTWTFTEATGVLSLAVGTGGPGFATWASANGIPGEPATGDFDHDGLTNLTEYAIGTSPTVSSTPAGTFAGGTLSFNKGAAAFANGDVTWTIVDSDDLGVSDPWTPVTPTVNNPTTISYTLPPGKPKTFARLKVGQP